MTDFTREEIRSQLNMQGFDPPEPAFTEVVYRINALIEGLKKLDDLDVYHIEPWPLMPYRGLPQRSVGQGAGTMYPYLGPWPGTARLLSETAAVRAVGAGGERRQC